MYYDNVLRDGLGHFDGIVVVIPYDEVLVWPCSAYYIRTGPPYVLASDNRKLASHVAINR